MMQSSSSTLMSEDVTIRCRVRRAPSSTSSHWNDPQEMTCTMRHWDSNPRPRRLAAIAPEQHVKEPQLYLAPLQDMGSRYINKDESPMRRRPIHIQQTTAATVQESPSYLLAVNDLLSCDLNCVDKEMGLTTVSQGYFLFSSLNQNAFDILMAFLQARIQPERICCTPIPEEDVVGNASKRNNKHRNKRVPSSPEIFPSSSSITSCFDVDALQAAHLKGRAGQETWSEKISRRISHVLAYVVGDGGCAATMDWDKAADSCSACCPQQPVDATQSPGTPQGQQEHTRPFHYSDLELDDSDSALSSSAGPTAAQLATLSQAGSSQYNDGNADATSPSESDTMQHIRL